MKKPINKSLILYKKKKGEKFVSFLSELEIKDCHKLFQELFPEKIYENTEKEKINDSYIRITNIGNNKGYMYPVSDILNFEKLTKILKKYKKENLAITFNTFSNCKNKNKLGGLFSVNVLAIDIDFKKAGYYNSESVLYYLEEDYFGKTIPIPNYIEIGNQMRLIYILKEPMHFSSKKHFQIRNFTRFVVKLISDKLEEFGAEVQGLNTYIRLPHSINTKEGKTEVNFVSYNDYQYSFQELVDEFIPDLPKWWIPKKERKKRKKRHNIKIFNQNRLTDFKILQKYFNEIETEGHRELLCFYYRNYALLSGYTKEDAKNMTITFNEGFKKPLPEKRMLSYTNNTNYKLYFYSNKALMEKLNISEELSEELGLLTIHKKQAKYTKEERKEYNHNYYMKHIRKSRKMTRKQLTEKIKNIVLQEKLKKYTNYQIKMILQHYYKIKLSIKSIERYVHTLILEGLYSPH